MRGRTRKEEGGVITAEGREGGEGERGGDLMCKRNKKKEYFYELLLFYFTGIFLVLEKGY